MSSYYGVPPEMYTQENMEALDKTWREFWQEADQANIEEAHKFQANIEEAHKALTQPDPNVGFQPDMTEEIQKQITEEIQKQIEDCVWNTSVPSRYKYSSFNGGVTVDVERNCSVPWNWEGHSPSHGSPGTKFPVGTPRQPVNNLTEALAIADVRKQQVHAMYNWDGSQPDMTEEIQKQINLTHGQVMEQYEEEMQKSLLYDEVKRMLGLNEFEQDTITSASTTSAIRDVENVTPDRNANLPPSPLITITNTNDNEVLVNIDCSTGTVEFGESYAFDEVSRIFWECLAGESPRALKNEIEFLNFKIEELKGLKTPKVGQLCTGGRFLVQGNQRAEGVDTDKYYRWDGSEWKETNEFNHIGSKEDPNTAYERAMKLVE